MLDDKIMDLYVGIRDYEKNCFFPNDDTSDCKYRKVRYTIHDRSEYSGIPFIVCSITGQDCSDESCPLKSGELKECKKCKGKGYIYKKKK